MFACNENLEICSPFRTTAGVKEPCPEIKEILQTLRTWTSQERGRQTELARRLGVKRSTVNERLKGRALPSWEVGRKLEKFLKSQRARKVPKPKESQPE
jgi:ribosome-binding protein aMBF1 (putative translation factor)